MTRRGRPRLLVDALPLSVRFGRQDRELLERACQVVGGFIGPPPVSSFVRRAALTKARELLGAAVERELETLGPPELPIPERKEPEPPAPAPVGFVPQSRRSAR